MKKYLSLLVLLFILTSCKESVISKPKNLISQDEMVNIIYDLSLIDGIKVVKSSDYRSLKAKDFVYKKYKIDSLQFVKSTQFYASDINNYKKIYEEVANRIDSQKNTLQPLNVKDKAPANN